MKFYFIVTETHLSNFPTELFFNESWEGVREVSALSLAKAATLTRQSLRVIHIFLYVKENKHIIATSLMLFPGESDIPSGNDHI